jgi:hypothetical protein
MTTAPYVELRVNPTDLRPGDLPKAGEFLGTPADAIQAALAMTRAAMVDQMKGEISGIGQPSHYQLMRIADLAWQASFWRFRKVSAPIIADAYLQAYRAADAGDVPMSVIYDLADKHAEKIGLYFHETSRQALSEGFNSMVNRQIPARVAADRVMDAYGLTPRQMRGYVANKQFNTPIMDIVPRALKERARTYIDRAFIQRTKKLSEQEEHNIDEQAKQFAWMWMQDKGLLNEKAQKLWITARDERVCPVCGPLHGRKVLVGEQFKTHVGDFWSPGLHPNCRCVVRLLENRFSKALGGLELKEFNEEHPRGYGGRFGTKTRTKLAVLDTDEEFERITQGMTTAEPTTVDPQQDLKFAEIAQYSWLPLARANVTPALPQTYAVVEAPVETKVWTPVVTPMEDTKVETKVQAPARAKAKLKPVIAPVKTKFGDVGWVVADTYNLGDFLNLEFTGSERVYNSRRQAERAASDAIRGHVDRAVSDIMRDTGGEFTLPDGSRHRMSREQVQIMAESEARQAQYQFGGSPGVDITPPKPEAISVRTPTGDTRVPLEDIATQFEQLNRNDLVSPIVAIDRKHGETSEPEEYGLDPRLYKPVTEFYGDFRMRAGKNSGMADRQEFNAPIVDAVPKKQQRLGHPYD